MSYVPPHARTKKISDKNKTPVKMFKQEFPQLANPLIDDKPKLDFSKLFKNLIEKRNKKLNKMKWGMIKLTQDGIIDSLTIEEREEDDVNRNNTRIRLNLEKLSLRIENNIIKRMEDDPDYEPYVVSSSSEEKSYESENTEESLEAEDPEEDEF